MDRYLDIAGSEQILSIYGEWPSFHDAEIISVFLDRKRYEGKYGPTVKVHVHCFEITNEIVDGHYKTINHNVINFAFYDVVEFELNGFDHQNILSGLNIKNIRSYQLENINYQVNFTCGLHFQCSTIEILTVETGIPNDSVYAKQT
jgi:Immunity protein 50